MNHKERLKELIKKVYNYAESGDVELLHYFEHQLEGYLTALVDLQLATEKEKKEILEAVDSKAFKIFLEL